MRAVVQRVRNAQVTVNDEVTGRAQNGVLVYLGVAQGDTQADADFLADKVAGLRIFEDNDGKMNLSVSDIKGEALVISQFTLLGDARKGRRPSYSEAAAPETAQRLYEYFTQQLSALGVPTQTGVFQTFMQVSYTNEGPVTILLDSRKLF